MALNWIKNLLSGTRQPAGDRLDIKLSSVDGAEGERLYKRLQKTGVALHEHGLELKRDPDTNIVYLVEYNEKGFGNFYTLLRLSTEDAITAIETPNSLDVYRQTRRWQTSQQYPVNNS